METHQRKSIYNWKSRNVISDDFDKLYEHHMNINNCQLCKVEFNKDIMMERRCLDHDHKTGLYRQTICHKCNIQFDKQKYKNNKSGYKNIILTVNNTYKYEKVVNGKRIAKYFKTIEEAVDFKNKFEK